MHPEVRQDHLGAVQSATFGARGRGVPWHREHVSHSMQPAAPAPANTPQAPRRQSRAERSTPAPCTQRCARTTLAFCPKCGMTLEPIIPLDEEDNHELLDFQRRFWWTLPLTVIVAILAMFGHRPDGSTCKYRHGLNWLCRYLSCCGRAGLSSCRVGSPSSIAAPTCGPFDRSGHRGAAFLLQPSGYPGAGRIPRTCSSPWGGWRSTMRRRWSSFR